MEQIEEYTLLRPNSIEEYVGQSKLKEKLRISIEAAKARGDSVDHLLLYGPPGLGKTTMARLVSKELGVNFKVTSGPVLEKVGDIVAILMSLSDGDFLFIDEMHRINKSVEEMLYPAMEDRSVDVVVGKGPTSKSVRFTLKNFTIIGATTKVSMLSAPLRDRFGLTHRVEYYSNGDISNIIKRSASLLGIGVEDDASLEIARRSRGTPRIANRLLKRVRDFVEVKGGNVVTLPAARVALNMLEVDSKGLDQLDRAIIETVIDKYTGGPVGLNAIAMALGEDRRTIEEVHEPYLVKAGLIERTSRGRVATKLAYKHLNRHLDENI